jgi:hypothetical protein
LTGDLVPSIDNRFSLGTALFRWKSLQLGPGTLFIQDQITGAQVGLTVKDGALLLDGADSLRIGNTRLTTTGLASVLSDADITIGAYGDQGFALFPTGIKFSDGTIMTTAMMAGAAGSPGPTGPAGATGVPGPAGSPGAPLAIGTQAPSSVLNLTKQVFVLTIGTWTLPDGVEGQVIYFTMATGYDTHDVYVTVATLRDLTHGVSHVYTNARWTPFSIQGGSRVPALTVAVFTQGAWNVSAGEIR